MMTGSFPSPVTSTIRRKFLAAGAVSAIFGTLLLFLSPRGPIPWSQEMLEAAHIMDSALVAISRHCQDRGFTMAQGVFPDPGPGSRGECLLGPEYSPLFTSLGQIEAKRSTLTPDMAGLLVHLLARAGVGSGDRVAIGASGSFPGLLVAVVAAVKALDAKPVPILSLGASSFGATRPDFHILDLYRFLQAEGFVSAEVAAVSLGGARDVGSDLDPEFRAELVRSLAGIGANLIQEPDLPRNVARRMDRYGSVSAFVNIGGAEANLGTSPRILEVPPGLVEGSKSLPPESRRGVLFEMQARGIPVVHLLHVRGLVLRYGLPWDPLPIPPPGTANLHEGGEDRGAWFWPLTVAYFGILLLIGLGWPGRGGWGRPTGG
jgi:poly-gamma-glutamate system protein